MFVFDIEVFMFDWLVVFKDIETQEYTKIINNTDELRIFCTKNKHKLFFGYNNKHFDDIVLDSILSNIDPYGVMLLIFKETPPFKIYKSFQIKKGTLNTFDLMQDILSMSLKEAEGYVGLSIEESPVDFNIDRKLTTEELDIVLKYCQHDVDATETLLKYRQVYVKSKMNLCKMFNLPLSCLNKTNASLSGIILEAKKQEHDDELKYDLPKEIIINNPNYKRCLDLYVEKELNYSDKLKINIAGVPHILGYGGIHGALDNYEYKGEMWQIDAASFYPTLMLEYKYVSRNVKDYSKYKEIYDTRIALKKTDKPKSDALKLVLNYWVQV